MKRRCGTVSAALHAQGVDSPATFRNSMLSQFVPAKKLTSSYVAPAEPALFAMLEVTADSQLDQRAVGWKPWSTWEWCDEADLVTTAVRWPEILYPGLKGSRSVVEPFATRTLHWIRLLESYQIQARQVLNMIRKGLIPEFERPPRQSQVPCEPQYTAEQVTMVSLILEDWLNTNIVRKVPRAELDAERNHFVSTHRSDKMMHLDGSPFPVPVDLLPFVSTIFSVPKKGSRLDRGIVTLGGQGSRVYLNDFVIKRKFKMGGIQEVKDSLQEGDEMTSVDLEKAYNSLGFRKRYWKVFRFVFRGGLYEFTCLMFGLTSAPRLFTKALAPHHKWLTLRWGGAGLRSAKLLDDSLLMRQPTNLDIGEPDARLLQSPCLASTCHSSSKRQLVGSEGLIMITQEYMHMLADTGFIPSREKSRTVPSTRREYLGFIWDSVRSKI